MKKGGRRRVRPRFQSAASLLDVRSSLGVGAASAVIVAGGSALVQQLAPAPPAPRVKRPRQRQSRDFAAALKAAGKPVQFLVEEGYNHFQMIETLANPYGLLGRSLLQQMGLAQARRQCRPTNACTGPPQANLRFPRASGPRRPVMRGVRRTDASAIRARMGR